VVDWETRRAMALVASALGLVLPNTPVWQAIDDLILSLASNPSRKGEAKELRVRLRGMSQGRDRLHLLAWEAGFLTATVREILPIQEEQGGEEEEETGEHDDFSRQPPPFRYRGRDYHFPYRQALLLECLLGQGTVFEAEVVEHVWSQPPKNFRGRLRKLQMDTNSSLAELSLPFKILRPCDRHLQLCRLSAKYFG
jgi:hypothetical protein